MNQKKTAESANLDLKTGIEKHYGSENTGTAGSENAGKAAAPQKASVLFAARQASPSGPRPPGMHTRH